MLMQVKELKVEGLKHELEITVPATEVENRIGKRLEEHGKSLNISGFRPGKIPLSILKQRYGLVARHEVIDQIVEESAYKALETKKIQPAMRPNTTVISNEEDKDLVFKVSVESLPEINIPDLKKYSFDRMVSEVEQDKLDKSLQTLLENNKQEKELANPRAAKKGDVVVIDFEGLVDNKPLKNGSGKDFHLTLGAGMFIPGFEEQLEGVNRGDKREVKVKFPDTYHAEEIAGKDATFNVTVHDILELTAPEANDDFAKRVGFTTVDQLKDFIKQQMQSEYDRMSFLLMKRAILDKFSDDFKFDAPQSLIENEFNVIWEELKREASDDESKKSIESEETRKQYQDIADRRVRLGLVLAEIGKQNKITVDQKELDRAIIEQARLYPGQERKVVDYFRSNPQALASLKAPIFEDKVIQSIISGVAITDKKVSLKDLEEAVKKITEGDE